MSPETLVIALVAASARALFTVARRPILLLLVTLTFITSAALSLALSAIVFTGWWQGFLLEIGVGLLIAGIVDVAILGALHGLIEGDGDGARIRRILDTATRIEALLMAGDRAAAQGTDSARQRS